MCIRDSPKYRGSAPIQRAVLNGEKVTGVTSMYLAEEMDAGDIIFTQETEVGETETSGQLFDRLAQMGADLLSRTVDAIAQGTAPRTPQDNAEATYAPPISKEESEIDWTKTGPEILNKIRGLLPWPVATSVLGGTKFKIYSAEFTEGDAGAPGTVKTDGGKLLVSCSGGVIRIAELQAAGGKRMAAADYLRGHSIV